jgi:hypothetical protein
MTDSPELGAARDSTAGSPSPALPARGQAGTRSVSIVRVCYGVMLLAAPGPLIAAVTGAPASARVCTVARVLGIRQVAQGTLTFAAPTIGLIQAGAAADGLHAVSMLALAGTEPGLRRALLAEAAIAAAFGSAAAASR